MDINVAFSMRRVNFVYQYRTQGRLQEFGLLYAHMMPKGGGVIIIWR